MRLSIRKLPALFDIIFLLVTILEAIVLFFTCLTSSTLRLADFLGVYSDISAKIFWIFAAGILLHIISYIKSLDNNWLLFANICGIFAYLIYWILPFYFPAALILQWVAIYNLLNHARTQKLPRL